MRNVEIRKVSNGFVVLPPYNGGCSTMTDGSGISVFETFDALTDFLRKTLDTDASKRDPSTYLVRSGEG